MKWYSLDDETVKPEQGASVLIALSDGEASFWHYDVAEYDKRRGFSGHWMDYQEAWGPVAWAYFPEPPKEWLKPKEDSDGECD